jgi:hypothetical protein
MEEQEEGRGGETNRDAQEGDQGGVQCLALSGEPIDGHLARGPWVGPKHDFLPDTSTSPTRFFRAWAGTSTTLGWAGLHSQPIVLAQHGTKSAGPTEHDGLARWPMAQLAQTAQLARHIKVCSSPPNPNPSPPVPFLCRRPSRPLLHHRLRRRRLNPPPPRAAAAAD